MPNVFDWRDYVRFGSGRNGYCDSGDCVVRASRVKLGSRRSILNSLAGQKYLG